MAGYDPKTVESEWQRRWEEARAFYTEAADPGVERFYCLEMLPYPSGRLHMGHVRNYAIGDAVSRFERMRGRQVMHVLGWDAFGLPAENAAIQQGERPRDWTLRNIESMREQTRRLGFGYDWDREVSTCDPAFYRWNQWFFLRMLERGSAYRAKRPLNWCDSCATVLANEQVHAGRCWRCDSTVEIREFDQWFLRITDYAQELLDDLDGLPGWPEKVRTMQTNWIGRSEGTRCRFAVEGSELEIEIFTTRVDTIFGATYVALAVEHPDLETLVRGIPEEQEVRRFVDTQRARDVAARLDEAAEKLGVFTGRYALNPYSGERVPIWVANFVLGDVGTGAIMSVPAHDERDFAFAAKYGLPVRPVIRPADAAEPFRGDTMTAAFTEDGVLEDSGPYSGLRSDEARARMTAEAESNGFGSAEVSFRLKDWGISRQRFWGTPIPVVHCPGCGPVGVPDEDLPVLLPEDAPLTGKGGSPLAHVPEFVRTRCPKCDGPAERDTDTMDTFVDSAWYYHRYLDPRNDRAAFDAAAAAPWLPVDLYIGGVEHAIMHLIYTRFWHKMMRDLGLVACDEPVRNLFTQGMVIKDGVKMSKSKGNAVDPDELVDRYGADTTRLFSLFAAPADRDLEWSDEGVEGSSRFLARLWRAFDRVRSRLGRPGAPPPEGVDSGDAVALRRKTHWAIRRVTDGFGPRMGLNTSVAAVMELLNTVSPLTDRDELDAAVAWAVRECFETTARLLAPFAPHFAEELWASLGGEDFVIRSPWPVADASLLVEDSVTVAVQVNGKLRGRVSLARGMAEDEAVTVATADTHVASHLADKTIHRVVWVPDRLLNLVVR